MNRFLTISFLLLCTLSLSVGYGQVLHGGRHINHTHFSRSTSTDQTTQLVAIDVRETREEEDENEFDSFKKHIENSKYTTAFFYSLNPVKEELAATKSFASKLSNHIYIALEVFRL